LTGKKKNSAGGEGLTPQKRRGVKKKGVFENRVGNVDGYGRRGGTYRG